MTDKTIRADLTAEATDYILDRYTDRPMEEPTENRFRQLLQEFEVKKRRFLNDAEVRATKINLRWVWADITPGLCPPDNVRVQMDESSTGWKQRVENNAKEDGMMFLGSYPDLDTVKRAHPSPRPNSVCFLSEVEIDSGKIYIAIVENGKWVQVLFSPDETDYAPRSN